MLRNDLDRVRIFFFTCTPGKKAIQKEPERFGYPINLLLISRYLEGIADHATNTAEAELQGAVFPWTAKPKPFRCRVKFM
jgi:hypothetical protein